MAYLAKEESLKQWAELVSETEVNSLNRIQNVEFTALMLTRLDPQYFQPIVTLHGEGITLSQLFTEIIKYYSIEIGTNINHILSDSINIYSTSSIEQIWQLVLGIAIKGRNRQKNINTILRMRTQTQEELMRIISKLINKLGENVSVIESGNAQQNQSAINMGSNDTNIIIELSEENEQLRERVEELSGQIQGLSEKNGTLKAQLEARNRERRDIINIMVKEPISAKSGFIYSSGGADSIAEFIKDLISQINLLTKELAKKEEKQSYFEDVNKDLKLAYSTVFMQLEEMRNVSSETHVDIKEVQKQIQELRAENLDYADREKDYVNKIRELEEQKFYLKEIVQRLEIKNNISEQKIDKILAVNKVIPQVPEQFRQKQTEKPMTIRIKDTDSLIESTEFKVQKDDRQKTVRNQIDETRQPNEKNKLQREVSHLQKKLNSLQEQNGSLKQINSILERVINDFTKESEEIIKNYQSEIEPIFEEFSKMLEEEKEKRKNVEEELDSKQRENENRMKELLQKIKEKMDTFDSKELEYQKAIRKIEIQRDQLLKALKIFEERPTILERNKKSPAAFKVDQAIPSMTIENRNEPEPQRPEVKKTSQIIQKEEEKVSEIKIEEIVNDKANEESKTETKEEPDENHLVIKSKNTVAASILMQEQEEETETNFRKRQYSFMGNKQSTIQFGNEGQLGLKQRVPSINKMSSIGSFINQQVEKEEPSEIKVETLGHIQIIDITQIEEELLKIKDHYLGLINQSQKLCESWMNRNKEKEVPKESALPQIIKDCEVLAQKTDDPSKIEAFLKKFQSQGLQKGKLTAQNVKIKQENHALRKQVLHLSKEREAIEERLNYLHQQSAKSQEVRTKEELAKLGTAINEIKSVMLESQTNYIQIQEYLCKSLGDGDKLISSLTAQVETLKEELKQRQYALDQLSLESSLLMGAVLEFRNCSVNSF